MKKFARMLVIGLGLFFLGFLILGASLTVASSLQAKAILPKAEQFADDFFTQFNQGNFEGIYENLTDGRLKLTQNKDDFIALLKAVQRKIGKVVKKTREATKIQSVPDGLYFAISYVTLHEDGSAVETFTLRRNNQKKNDEQWLLTEYAVVSKELILR